MKILITGAEGFVGKNLVEKFQRDGCDVLHPGFQELDLTCAQSVQSYFNDNPIGVIVHSATTLRNGTEYPHDVCENNLRMFFNLVRQMKPSTKLINFGSGSEYSRKYWHKKMPETFFDSHVPDDPHSFSKYVISKYIENSTHQNMVTLRIFGIFGKHEDYRYKFISNAICKNLLHLDIVINQNVNYDYIYVDDFCEVVKYFVENDVSYRSYNVTPTAPIDLITVANLINEISDYQSPVHVLNDGIGIEYSGDNARLLNECGGLELMSYRDSISDLYRHYKAEISSLDKAALVDDDYLNYAKKLRSEYFSKKDDS
ncbi:NAD(P)-dependent oxidoreductase [Magnetovibrio sp.]|uniref:NAD-dependent epimerase/dehydratase family protein n=1 Tax=Magnetovibrio sp. TaxID=2024836 RepID=UPI002F95EA6F